MHMVCFDLEGILLPEIWIAIAKKTNCPELMRTTRDEPDYDKLMYYRLDILARHNISIDTIRKVVETLDPLPGALELTQWLIAHTRFIILSDTFVEFATPLMAKLGFPTLFCHSLVIDKAGKIVNYTLRQQDQKRKAVNAFRNLNFKVIASGDSYNDLAMIQAADYGILFRPPPALKAEYPKIPVVHDHAELRTRIAERLELCDG